MTNFPKLRVFLLCAAFVVVTESSSDIMQKMTIGFAKAMKQCKTELNVSEQLMQDFYNFWKEDYALVNREMGCVITCMASKFDLINEDLKLHHTNAHEFAKKHGADDTMAQQIVSMIHECEKVHVDVSDDCVRVLEMAKCFKTKIHGLNWAPSMEVILEEVMAEINSP